MPAISYTLLIDGQAADADLLERVQRVEVEEHAHLAAIVRLRLALSVRADGADWNVEDARFPRLGRIGIVVSVGRTRSPLIEAHVIDLEASFSNEPGKSTLDVVALDKTVLMNLEEKVRAWPNMSDSDIAAAILGEHGFSVVSKDTGSARQDLDTTVIQRGTDMQFLHELACRNGYECYVEVNRAGAVEGHFHPPALDQPPQGVLTVNMGDASNVNRFEAHFDMLRPTTVRATGLDVNSQARQDVEVSGLSNKNLGGRDALAADRPRVTLVTHTGLQKTDELQTLAQAVVDRSAWAITAEGELNPAAYGSVLRAHRLVSVRGAGKFFSGEYYVDKVLHVFDGNGYLQRFALRRNAQGLTGQEAFTDDGTDV